MALCYRVSQKMRINLLYTALFRKHNACSVPKMLWNLSRFKSIKGTVSIISSDPQWKKAMPDLQRYSYNLNLIKNVEENLAFFDSKSVEFWSFLHYFLKVKKCLSHICRDTLNDYKQKKIYLDIFVILDRTKHWRIPS